MIGRKGAAGKLWVLLRTVRIGSALADQWLRDDLGLCVLSAVESVPRNPPGPRAESVPHWHVSATRRGPAGQEACTDEEMERVRAAFDMGGAEEDNHGPGVARHLWLEVGRVVEPECPCKQDEERIVEGSRVRYDTEEDRATFASLRSRYLAELPRRFGGER